MPHQVPADLRRAIVELETRVESTFNNFRGEIDGRRVDDNAIAEILRTSDDADERPRRVGGVEADRSRGRRPASASSPASATRPRATLGLRDHFALALATGELDEDRLFATLDDVDRATAAPFAEWKHDARRSARDALRLSPSTTSGPGTTTTRSSRTPPAAGAIALDHLFADADLEALTVRTYDGLGLDVRSVLDHSDLYARDGKSQHAFCIDIDRDGDVRVLCNVEPSERWMDTMLHEFGHAIYDRECDRDAAVARARRRARAHHRGHRHAHAAGCRATRRGCARWPAVADADGRRRSRPRSPTRDAPRSSCSPAGCW